jgi:hypothetical protein
VADALAIVSSPQPLINPFCSDVCIECIPSAPAKVIKNAWSLSHNNTSQCSHCHPFFA